MAMGQLDFGTDTWTGNFEKDSGNQQISNIIYQVKQEVKCQSSIELAFQHKTMFYVIQSTNLCIVIINE
jgi:hypothetical protein